MDAIPPPFESRDQGAVHQPLHHLCSSSASPRWCDLSTSRKSRPRRRVCVGGWVGGCTYIVRHILYKHKHTYIHNTYRYVTTRTS
jgi:hypothetical protein